MQGAWLAQLVEHTTLILGVMSLSPTLDADITYKKKMGGMLMLIFKSI